VSSTTALVGSAAAITAHEVGRRSTLITVELWSRCYARYVDAMFSVRTDGHEIGPNTHSISISNLPPISFLSLISSHILHTHPLLQPQILMPIHMMPLPLLLLPITLNRLRRDPEPLNPRRHPAVRRRLQNHLPDLLFGGAVAQRPADVRGELGRAVLAAEHDDVEEGAGFELQAGAGPDPAPAGFCYELWERLVMWIGGWWEGGGGIIGRRSEVYFLHWLAKGIFGCVEAFADVVLAGDFDAHAEAFVVEDFVGFLDLVG